MWEIFHDIYLYWCGGIYYLNEKLNTKVVKGSTCKRSIKSRRWSFGHQDNTLHEGHACLHYCYAYIYSYTYKYSILLRSAQQRTLHRNELLHFQDRWKMCCMLLPCYSLFPYPLGFTWTAHRPATAGAAAAPASAGYQVLGTDRRAEGTGAEWGSGKMSSPSSSILQSYLVKANTGQYLPSCHWKGGSDASAWHTNIVTCTNDDASLASLFMASSNGGGRSQWKANDVQESNCQQVGHVQEVTETWMLAPATCSLSDVSPDAQDAFWTHMRKSRWWLKRRHTISCWWTAASKLW